MSNKKPKKSITGLLLLLLLVVLIVSALQEWSPFYYQNFFADKGENQESISKTDNVSVQSVKLNEELREKLKSGGNITFMYNYVPSERSWHTMYSYVIYRYQETGDFTFYCTRNAYESSNSGDMCSCLYSEKVWDDLLSLVLDHEELVDTTSVYDANGMVTSDPIPKTISIGSYGTYAPSNIDAIEAYFKKLAVNAGVAPSDLEWNVRVDDDNVVDKTTVTDLHGSFLINWIGGMSDDENKRLEAYLRSKYEETGVRMYVILLNVEDNDLLSEMCDGVLGRATSPAISFGLTSSQKHWSVRLRMKKDRESELREGYSKVADAFYDLKKGSLYDKIMKVIDKAYELYLESKVV
jgi:hypothetical protein